MYILGDIGNTETKIFLVSINNKIIKKLTYSTKDLNQTKLKKTPGASCKHAGGQQS